MLFIYFWSFNLKVHYKKQDNFSIASYAIIVVIFKEISTPRPPQNENVPGILFYKNNI